MADAGMMAAVAVLGALGGSAAGFACGWVAGHMCQGRHEGVPHAEAHEKRRGG